MHAIRITSLLALLFCAVPARSQFAELTADIETVSWGASLQDDPPLFVPQLWKVRCVVGTNSWLIAAHNDERFPETWFYTGSNLIHQYPKMLRKEAPPGATNDIHTSRTYPFKGDPDSSADSPFMFSGPFRAAWLAFCSGPFLNRPGRQIPQLSIFWKQNWLYYDFAAEPRGFRDKTAQFDDDFGAPISVEVQSKNGHPLLQYRVKHDHGPVAASAKIHDWNFPTEFRAIQYSPIGAAQDKWQTHLTARGTLTSIKAGSPPTMVLSTPQSSPRAKTNFSYVLRAGGPHSFNLLTNPPALNKLRISLRHRQFQHDPNQLAFTVTNHELEEILIWNVRVQTKSFGESPGTDGFGWDTVDDDYPHSSEAALLPGKSTDIHIKPPHAPLWRVCVLYSKYDKTKPGPKAYWGTDEIISQPIDDNILDKLYDH